MPSIQSVTKGPRQSNFELLRILAMFLVLVVHADFLSLGIPSDKNLISNPLNAFSRIFFQSLSIVCVNVFILISGWFGIKPSIKGICSFLFQCLYFYIGACIIHSFISGNQLSIYDLRTCILLTKSAGWFIISYLGLYVLSPILNEFLKLDKALIRKVLIGFYIFQSYFWIGGSVSFLSDGYSTFSFIGLYLLGRYLYLNKSDVYKWGGIGYIIAVILISLLSVIITRGHISLSVFAYDNPLIVAASAFLLLSFSNLRLGTIKWLNWISKSAFAVYLFHCNYYTLNYYTKYCLSIYKANSGIVYLLSIFAFMCLVFIIAILLDQPRKWIWNLISALFSTKKKREVVEY